MSKPKVEWKVGLFVLVTLVVLAGLMILFSKGGSFFRSTYQLKLKTTNVGLLIEGAPILMAGVQIGTIDRIRLDPGGKSVTLSAKIDQRYRIYEDARFVIDQIGLLGDQYVSVIPQRNQGRLLEDGNEVVCEEPFNMQSVARSSMGLIERVDETVQRLKTVVVRVDELLLSPDTLTNLTGTIARLRDLSDHAATGIEGLSELVQTNKDGLHYTISNLVVFSDQINNVARQLNDVVASNRLDFTAAVTNVRSATDTVNTLLQDLRAAKGMAGLLLQDTQARDQTSLLISNLTVLSSNLNRFGLLYKPRKPPDPNAARSPAGRQQLR